MICSTFSSRGSVIAPSQRMDVVKLLVKHFWAVMIFAGLVSFAVLVLAGRQGRMWVVAIPVLLSPVCLVVIRQVLEFGLPEGILDPRKGSWAFIIGDGFALPLMIRGSVLTWKAKRDDFAAFFLSNWWVVICLLLGIAAACGYHYLIEVPGYTKAGYAELLGSPSKLWHDFPVYGALSGGLLYLSVPAIAHGFKSFGWLCMVGFVLWIMLGLADNTTHKLDPSDLHPPENQTRLVR